MQTKLMQYDPLPYQDLGLGSAGGRLGLQQAQPLRITLGSAGFPDLEALVTYYYAHLEQFPAAGLIIENKFLGKELNVFGKTINLQIYFYGKTNQKKDFYIKLIKARQALLVEYYYDAECQKKLFSRYSDNNRKEVFIKFGQKIDIYYYNKRKGPVILFNKYAEYYYLHPQELPAEGLILPIELCSKVIKLFDKQINFKAYLPKKTDQQILFFAKIFYESGYILFRFYADQEGTTQLKSLDGVFCTKYLLLDKGNFYLEWENVALEKIINHYYLNQKLIPAAGLDLPAFREKINLFNHTRNFNQFFSENNISLGKVFPRLVVENGDFLLKYYADFARTMIFENYNIKRTDVFYAKNNKLIMESYRAFILRNFKIFIQKILAPDFQGELKFQYLLNYRICNVINKRNLFVTYAKNMKREDFGFYIVARKNALQDLELHYYYDQACTKPLKNTRKTRVDILSREPIMHFVPKRFSVDELDLDTLIKTAEENYRFKGLSMDDTIGDFMWTRHDVIGSETYAPETLIFSEGSDAEREKFRRQIINSFLRANAQEEQELNKKNIQNNILLRFFEMNYLEKDKNGYNDQLIADELNIPIDRIVYYQQHCEKILYSPEFARAVSDSGLLENTLGAYYDIPE